MGQKEGEEEQTDDLRCVGEMQSAAISAGKEGETGCPAPEALPVSVIYIYSMSLVFTSCKKPFGQQSTMLFCLVTPHMLLPM